MLIADFMCHMPENGFRIGLSVDISANIHVWGCGVTLSLVFSSTIFSFARTFVNHVDHYRRVALF